MSVPLVRLAPWEVEQAAIAGVLRALNGLLNARSQNYGAPGRDVWFRWGGDIEGALAECAVAKHLGMFWTGRGAVGQADLGDRIEVRQTTHSGGHLLLHDKDPDEYIFCLVTGAFGAYRLPGWIKGADGKVAEFWKTPPASGGRSAYFVPQSALNPFPIPLNEPEL